MIVHVEDKWWSDPRRFLLQECVGEELSEGIAVSFWRLAAWWCKYKDELYVPLKVYRLHQYSEEFMKVGLAEILENDVVYIKGSKDLYWQET